MKLAFADAHRYIADPRFMEVKVEQLLAPEYLDERFKLIDPTKAQDFKHGEPKPGGTILLCTAMPRATWSASFSRNMKVSARAW
jgi:gamma-glutamyltranspeptidase/glutathione hydrolase